MPNEAPEPEEEETLESLELDEKQLAALFPETNVMVSTLFTRP